MAAVHVLGRIDEVQERRLVEVLRHGKLQEYAADLRVGVELLYLRRHLLERGIRGHCLERGGDAHFGAAVDLVAHIHLARRIVAHEYDRKPYLSEFVLRQSLHLPRDVLTSKFCNEFSVYDLHTLSLSVAGIAGVLLNDVVRAAFRNAGGGNDGHLRGLLQLLDGDRAAVAHG